MTVYMEQAKARIEFSDGGGEGGKGIPPFSGHASHSFEKLYVSTILFSD